MVVRAGLALVALLVLIQFVPYGHNHTNPPVVNEPAWDSAETRALFMNTCGNCHSHETKWPWYASVAPASWLVQHDVDDAREHFNVSRWGEGKQHGDEAAEELREGEMPPWFYLPLNPEADLDPERKQALIRGLVATFGEEDSGEDHH